MSDAHITTKLQTYIMPDGREVTYTSTKNYPFLVATADPNWRTLRFCYTKKQAEEVLAYFRKIWASSPCPVKIVCRSKNEYIYREQVQA